MNEAKDNQEDGQQQRRVPMILGIGRQEQPAVPVVEPRLEKGDLRLKDGDFVPIAPKRKLGEDAVGPTKKARADATVVAAASSKPASVPQSDKAPFNLQVPLNVNDDYVAVKEGEEGIRMFSDKDVLCGRGGATNVHTGNVKFRDLVNQLRRKYLGGSMATKQAINLAIVKTIRKHGGRFLKHCDDDGLWYEIGDAAAREKTSQALRQKSACGDLRKTLVDANEAPPVDANEAPLVNVYEVQKQLRQLEQRQPRQLEQRQLEQQIQLERMQREQQQRLERIKLQQERLELLRQRRQQEEQMALAVAARHETVAIDPAALMAADPLVLQQALENPVFRALLAMNKVVIPVNQDATPAPMASTTQGNASHRGMGLPPPPALGNVGFGAVPAATASVPAATASVPASIMLNPGTSASAEETSLQMSPQAGDARNPTAASAGSQASAAPPPAPPTYDPFDERNRALMGYFSTQSPNRR